MYFEGIPSGLAEEVRTFVEKLSGELERLDPSLMDRARCAVVRGEADGSPVRIELPHREDAAFALRFCPEPGECIAYFGDAHVHFRDEGWQEGALNFLQAVLAGRIEARVVRIGGQPFIVKTCFLNEMGEWTVDGWEIYRPRLGVPERVVQRARFFTDEDFLRLQRLGAPDDGAVYAALPDDPYFSKVPADVPEGARRFFDLLRERLAKYAPPMLDRERARAYRREDEDDGEVFLCVLLPRLGERDCPVSADVYFDRCLLFYGNGRMLIDGEDWMEAALTMMGLVLTGNVEVRSVYRRDRLNAVVTRFLDEGHGHRDWTRRLKRRWLGKKRVDVWRANYFA
jgi:hypothetical protein